MSVFDSDRGNLAADASGDLAEVRMRLAVSGSERLPVDQSLQEVLALLCCGPAAGGGMRSQVQNRIRTVSYLVPRNMVSPRVEFCA
jgi:hypothetical protein